jgi:hypothetical protein
VKESCENGAASCVRQGIVSRSSVQYQGGIDCGSLWVFMVRRQWVPQYRRSLPGHGMSRIPAVTRAFARHILTGRRDPSLPQSFDITTNRLRRAKARAHWLDKPSGSEGIDIVAEKEHN